MGQFSSSYADQPESIKRFPDSFRLQLPSLLRFGEVDLINDLPDECLGLIFQSLSSADRKSCSVVCRRWFVVEGQSRQRLSLKAQSHLISFIPPLFSRFDSVTKLSLRCDRRSKSVNDDALTLISLKCPKITRLKLRGCRELTDVGMAAFAINSKCLRNFSCGSCSFGAKGMNALLHHSSSLQELSVKRLRGTSNDGTDPIGPALPTSSLKSIHLKELYDGLCFAPLIIGSKNLESLKLLQCLGDWDNVLQMVANGDNSLFEIYLDRVQVTDAGLSALSNCSQLQILHMIKTPDCTNTGIISVVERCKLLRKLHIDGWRTNRIGDEGLVSIGKHSAMLQELVLIGINPSVISLEAISSGCPKLERLALCGSKTIADAEMSCIATKFTALKKLCVKACPVSNKGIEAFAWGSPNLIKIKVKKCRAVTSEVEDLLRLRRKSLIVDMDAWELGVEAVDASDGGTQEDEVEFQTMANQEIVSEANSEAPSTTKSRSLASKPRCGLFGGRCFVACAIRRWSSSSSER